MREIRYMPIRALLLAALVPFAAALLQVAPARADSTQATLLQDDPKIVYTSNAKRTKRLNELQALGIDIVKVRLSWRFLAPIHRPRRFNGADPAAYGNGFDRYDQIVNGAQSRGMDVMFQMGGTAPEWATPGKSAIRNPHTAPRRVRQVRGGGGQALPQRPHVLRLERAEPGELALAAGERRRAAV